MEYTVVADGGTVELVGRTQAEAVPADGSEEELVVPPCDAYTAEIQYFVECCSAGVQPEICPPAESAAAVKLARLMLQARNQNGEKIPCELSSRWKSA